MQPFWVRLSALVIVMLLGWMATCRFFLTRHHQLKNLSEQMAVLTSRAETLQKQKNLHAQMKKQIAKAPSDYVTKNIETLQLLQGERHRTAALAKKFPDNVSLKERLQFLESDQNQIHFVELHLTHRVQMDVSDLRKFLELVEGDRYDAAQERHFLVMKKFDLLKCHEKGDEKVYSIYAELLQKQ